MGVSNEAVKFNVNNGIIMRTIAALFQKVWFSGSELSLALKAYGITQGEISVALDYLIDRRYVTVRSIESKQAVSFFDCELEDLEFKLAPDGRLIIISQLSDPGVVM
jgi:hypothetical protein